MMSLARLAAALPLLVLGAACGPGDDEPDAGSAPILDPEPAGAPTDLANAPPTRLSCLGHNAPVAPQAATLTLPGWVRALKDPQMAAQPAAHVEAFDESGMAVGSAFSDTGSGRVAVTVPILGKGFVGTVKATADGYVDQTFASSRPVTTTEAAGWAWMATQEELTALATDAGKTLDPAKGIVTGAVHDCVIFGVANAVVRVGGATDGVSYFDGFALAPMRTFTAKSGRFAVANVTPGPVTVEAFGRITAGGPLVLLSRADVKVEAGAVTAVDLEPRIGNDR